MNGREEKQTAWKPLLQLLQTGQAAERRFAFGALQKIRRFVPKERLILLGGGHVAVPLCRIGAMLDFSVVVVDDRLEFANSLRFPEADQVICDEFSHAITGLQIQNEDFVCTITRGHQYDAECLRSLLTGAMPRYLGMIGSKRRVCGLRELLQEEGFDPERIAAIHAPIGLPIHAQTTTEIAVSIAAELVECRRQPSGYQAELEEGCLPVTHVDWELMNILAEPKEPMMLAVVMETRGSTPVKAGAMMAVGKLGRIAGTIGGGCGEAEVIGQVRRILSTGTDRMIEVSMTNDTASEEGMVCGGTMKVLLQPISVEG